MVKHLLAQGVNLSPKVSQPLALEVSGQAKIEPHKSLSKRDREILRLPSAGVRVTDIAVMFRTSVKTLSTYGKRILVKMGLNTNAVLTPYAVSIGLLD